MNNISDEEILKLWRDVKFAGSYRGIKTFKILLKTDLNVDVSERRLYNIIKKDPIFLIHLKPKRNFPRRSYDLNYYGELFQCDIAYMFPSNNFKYFLVIIDCYSHKIFAEPLKDKSSETVLSAFKKGVNAFKCEITTIETDQGTEFNLIKKYCSQNKIVFKYKFGKNKARYVLLWLSYG